MADIKKLLNKKGWTGRELGIIELTNMSELYRQALAGNQDPTPLVEPGQFQKMINGIVDRSQGIVYNGYISIHEWLQVQLQAALAQDQQVQLQYKKLIDYVTNAITAEDAYRYAEQLPAIMTQKEYDEKRAAAIEARLVDEDGNDLEWNIYSIVEHAIQYFYNELERNPKKPNPLKPIKKKYERELVTSKLILESWNETVGNGYYTLEDGRRSDKMTAEEWQEAITTPAMKQALENMEATGAGGRVIADQIAQRRYTERAKVIMLGGTEQDADKNQQKNDYERGLAVPAEWHYYEEQPADLTKWEVVETGLWEFYLPWEEWDGAEEALADFYSEFQELVKAVLEELDRGEWFSPALSSYQLKDWLTTTYTVRSLYEGGFYGMDEFIAGYDSIWDGNRKALFNGIAIYTPSPMWAEARGGNEERKRKQAHLDERGYYVLPDITATLHHLSLEAFFTDGEDYARNVDIVERGREALLDSYYFIKGFNTALDLIATYFDVPALEVFKVDVGDAEQKMDAFNELVPVLYYRIHGTDYEDKELKKRKLQVIQDIFYPLDYKSLAIPEANIEEVKARFKDFRAFKDTTILDLLCSRPLQDEDEGEGAAEW